MKLIGAARSPYVRKVRIVLEEKRIPYDFVTDRTGLAGANPLAKVPTLILDNGKSLYDSPVIVEYLDGIVRDPKLIPDAFEQRIEARRWEALGDGIADATVLISHDRRKVKELQETAEWYDKQRQKIDRGLAVIARDLAGQSFCLGGSFSLADVATGYALGYIDLVCPDIDWRTPHPNLSKFAERCATRESFRLTAHPA
jgi:glutathione S-transferase